MDNNKLEILKMIRDGRITPEEGMELLKAIEPSGTVRKSDTGVPVKRMDDSDTYAFTVKNGDACCGESADDAGEEPGAKKKPRFLMIQVTEGGKKKVNVKIPLKLAKLASRFIPKSAQAQMKAEGVEIDLNELLSEIEKVGCFEDLINVVDDEKGEMVRIYCC